MGHSLGTPAPKRLPERSWGITAGSEMHARAGRVEGVAKTRGRLPPALRLAVVVVISREGRQ